MKLTSNNYLFSNFNGEFLSESISKNSLTINNIYNLTTQNNTIEPVCNFSDLFENCFSLEFINTIKVKYFDLFNSINCFYIYDYYDDSSNLIKTRYFVTNNNFNIFEIDYENFNIIDLNFKFNTKPSFLLLNEKLYIYSFNNLFLMINKDNYPIVLSDVLNITSINDIDKYTIFTCFENKFSVFYTEKTELLNLEQNLSNYNEIKLSPEDGEIERVFIYKNNIYAVQKYAISKIIIQNNGVSISNLCSIKSSIIFNSIELIDDYIVFLTTSGLFIFDGNDIKQIFKKETINLIKSNVKSVSYNNKYYLMCNYFINHIKESMILEFDIEDNICTFYKIESLLDITLLKTFSTYKLIAITNNNNINQVKFLDLNKITTYKKYVRFNKLTFDDKPVKVLNELKIISIGKFLVTISSEIQSSTFEINGISYIKNIGIKGQTFEIEIQSDDSFKIESIYIKTTSYSED